MSQIARYMSGEQPDALGRYIKEIHAYNHFWLEHDHKYIQVLFPIDYGHKFNKHAPLVSESDRALFRCASALRAAHLRSLDLMLDYYGLQRVEQQILVRDELSPKKHEWLKVKNHNQLRLTRIIRSLYLLGNQQIAINLQQVCIKEGQRIGTVDDNTIEHWLRATQ